MGLGTRELMALRAAREIAPGSIVNLGIGIPTLTANYIPKGLRIVLHSENGFLGMGPSPEKGKEDPNLINAGGFPVTIQSCGCYFDSLTSFAIIRGGKLDVTVLGALEVSEKGDLANWIVPGKIVPGMGGGMDLALKARKTIILTTHVNKKGEPKILKKCTLPLTAEGCVNLIITDLAVLEVTDQGLVLRETAEGVSVEEAVAKTEASLIIPDKVGTMPTTTEGGDV